MTEQRPCPRRKWHPAHKYMNGRIAYQCPGRPDAVCRCGHAQGQHCTFTSPALCDTQIGRAACPCQEYQPNTPAEHCGNRTTGLIGGQRTECVLRPGHQGSHADHTGCRWWEEPRDAEAEEATARRYADIINAPLSEQAIEYLNSRIAADDMPRRSVRRRTRIPECGPDCSEQHTYADGCAALAPRAERCPDPQCSDAAQCWRCDAEESQHAGRTTADDLDTLRRRIATLEAVCQSNKRAYVGAVQDCEAAEQRIRELESLARDSDRLRQDWTEMRGRAEAAEAATARVRALHYPVERRGMTICADCSGWDGQTCDNQPAGYPCPTIDALNGSSDRSD